MLDDLPSPTVLTLHLTIYRPSEIVEIKQTAHSTNAINALRTALLKGTGSQTTVIDWLAGVISKLGASKAPTPEEREAADAFVAAANRYCDAIAQQETQGTT